MTGAEKPIDCQALGGGAAARAALGRGLLAALGGPGFAALAGHGLGALPGEVLATARALFALPAADKDAIHIRRSPHFRGYSEMRNARDWREQLHLASEEAGGPGVAGGTDAAGGPGVAGGPGAAGGPGVDGGPPWERLRGPNLWPAALGAPFRDVMLAYLERGGRLGAALLSALALGLELDEGALGAAASRYLLLKLICYHPQPPAAPPRPGVAPHCDWSLVTLLTQDAPGLEVRGTDGRWRAAAAAPGELLLNAGELLEVASGGRVPASPHQVVNPSREAARIGVPLFINPGLAERVGPLAPAVAPGAAPAAHVHRVLPPGTVAAGAAPFVFGDSEWRRKGLGRWCHDAACLGG